jgi:hypothetical protein
MLEQVGGLDQRDQEELQARIENTCASRTSSLEDPQNWNRYLVSTQAAKFKQTPRDFANAMLSHARCVRLTMDHDRASPKLGSLVATPIASRAIKC